MSASISLQYLPVPLFTVFKNLAIILTAYAEYKFFHGAPISRPILISFSLMALSSLFGALSDLHFSVVGYAWMTANAFSSAAYVLTLRRAMRKVAFKDFDTVYYGNIMSLPILVVMGLLVEDWFSFIIF